MSYTVWLPAIFVFLAVAFGALSLILSWEAFLAWRRRRDVTRRLKPVVLGTSVAEEGDESKLRKRVTTGADGLMGWLPGLRGLDEFLGQAGLMWSPETYVLVTLGFALGLGAATLIAANQLVAATVAAVIGATLPYLYVRHKRIRRMMSFEEHFPEAIDLLTRAIRAGHPLSSGMRMVAEEAPEVVANEFRQAFEEQRFGLPFEDALMGMVSRVDLMDIRIFVTAVLVQREVGGNLAEILDNLATTVRARFAIRRQLRVYTAQGRLSGYILGALPIIVALIILGLNRDYMMTLFTEPVGRIMVATAAVMQILGYLWIRKIVNIEI